MDEIGIRGLVSIGFFCFFISSKKQFVFFAVGRDILLIIAVRPIVSDGPGILHGEECGMNT